MELIINDAKKRVELWLTRDEKDDAALRESLNSVFSEYKEMKYLVSVFESGSRDLFANTRDLLIANKQNLAKTL